MSADEPLLCSRTTTLEKEHAAFVLSLAHAAEIVVSLDLGGKFDERELLYFIASDGTARVFERGQ